jgi:hypothetical protein
MLGADRLDLVVPQEPCDPGMMSALGALVVEGSPGNGELLPAVDVATDHISGRSAISPVAARVNSTMSQRKSRICVRRISQRDLFTATIDDNVSPLTLAWQKL